MFVALSASVCTKHHGHRQSSRFPATRHVYAHMLFVSQCRGATQTHFPQRPRKSIWLSNVADANSPHGAPLTRYNKVARSFPHYIVVSCEATALRTCFPYDFCAPSGATVPNCLPHSQHICTTKLPLLSHTASSTSCQSFQKLFPILHLHCKIANSEGSSRLPRSRFPHCSCTTNFPVMRPRSATVADFRATSTFIFKDDR